MSTANQPANFQRLLQQSAQLLAQNRPGEAAQLLEPLYKQHPTDPDVAINLGGAYILQRRWNRATRLLQKAAEANPTNAMVWVNLAAAELGNLQIAGPQQQKRAIRAYERALEVDPKTPNVHYHLGLIYKERNELNRACAFFQRALEVHPGDKDARYWLDRLTAILAADPTANTPSRDDDAGSADDATEDPGVAGDRGVGEDEDDLPPLTDQEGAR